MILLVTLGAGLGAVMRYVLTQAGHEWWPDLPLATVMINLSGAFLAGLLAVLALPQTWSLLLLTGVCGGYTTFSTYMTETLILLRNRQYKAFAWYYFGTAIAGIAAVAAGGWIGRLY